MDILYHSRYVSHAAVLWQESRPASGGNIQVNLERVLAQGPPSWSLAGPMGNMRNRLYPDVGWPVVTENSSSAHHWFIKTWL